MLQCRLEHSDYINAAIFLNDDFMFAVSENGFLYMFDIQDMLMKDHHNENGYTNIKYEPSILYDATLESDSFFTLCSCENKLFISGANGNIFVFDLSDFEKSESVKLINKIDLSTQHISSLAYDPISDVLCASDESYIYFIDKNHNLTIKISIRTSNIKFSNKLGFVIASNDNSIHIVNSSGDIIEEIIDIQFEQHPLSNIHVNDLYVTSLDLLDDRYLILGTNKPSILMYDLELKTVVNEKFLDPHLTSTFNSSVYDLSVFQDQFVICRSKLNHFGIWQIIKF